MPVYGFLIKVIVNLVERREEKIHWTLRRKAKPIW